MALIKVLNTQGTRRILFVMDSMLVLFSKCLSSGGKKIAKFLNKTGSNCCSHLNRDFPNLTDFIMIGLKCFINELFNA